MALDDKKQPIIVKKVYKKAGHHGGSWKVAFADFATAMMAFFLVLWLLNATTAEQLGGISEYFRNPSAVEGKSTASPGSLGDGTGVAPALINLEGAIDVAPESLRDADSSQELSEQLEREQLESLMQILRENIDSSQALAPFKDQLLLDLTPEGLRIQIVDHENRPMFDLGSATLLGYSQAILRELGALINEVPNKVSITGHTDARPLLRANYSNWELSAERANAARRALVTGGMQPEKIGRVVGLADTVLFDKEDPLSSVNRRISIIVLNKRAEDAIALDGQLPDVPPTQERGDAP